MVGSNRIRWGHTPDQPLGNRLQTRASSIVSLASQVGMIADVVYRGRSDVMLLDVL